MVLVAAGLDTRAYRLQWPTGVHLYELDLPEVLTFKEAVLAARGGQPDANAPPCRSTCARSGRPH